MVPLDRNFIFTPSVSTTLIPISEWNSENKDLHVDIGCGKGRFLINAAKQNPNIFIIGVDIRLRRLRKIEKMALSEGIFNIHLIKCEAAYFVSCLLPANIISTYYVFFPDPWPKRKHSQRRLFKESFIADIYKTMINGGKIHIATDNSEYYHHIINLFQKSKLFVSTELFQPPDDIKSDFEATFSQKNINVFRCSFQKPEV